MGERKRRRDGEASQMMSDFKISDSHEDSEFICAEHMCLLCMKGLPPCLSSNYTTWKDIAKVILFSMQNSRTSQEFFHLKFDIYPFIMSHRCLMAIIQPKIINAASGTSWHKQLQDALSHDKRLFRSGIAVYGKNGFWRLSEWQDRQDPWSISELQYREFNCSPSPPSSPKGADVDPALEAAAREMRYELQRMRQTALGLEDSMARLVQKHSTTSVLSNERRVNDIISEINAINDDLSSNAITLLGIDDGVSASVILHRISI